MYEWGFGEVATTGLQCFDENGIEVFNTNMTTLRYVGSFSAYMSHFYGTVSNPMLHQRCICVGEAEGTNMAVSIAPYEDGVAQFFSWYRQRNVNVYVYEY